MVTSLLFMVASWFVEFLLVQLGCLVSASPRVTSSSRQFLLLIQLVHFVSPVVRHHPFATVIDLAA